MNPPAVGAKAVLKPTKAITTSANPVIRIVFNRLKSSSSPSSPTSRKPTEIVIVKTSSAAISTQRLLIVSTTFVSFRSRERIPLELPDARRSPGSHLLRGGLRSASRKRRRHLRRPTRSRAALHPPPDAVAFPPKRDSYVSRARSSRQECASCASSCWSVMKPRRLSGSNVVPYRSGSCASRLRVLVVAYISNKQVLARPVRGGR